MRGLEVRHLQPVMTGTGCEWSKLVSTENAPWKSAITSNITTLKMYGRTIHQRMRRELYYQPGSKSAYREGRISSVTHEKMR